MRRRLTTHALGWALLGGLLAGSLDMLYATGFWSFYGVPAQRIAQSVAAGLLGRDAFTGGASTAALGLALHFLIAVGMSLAYTWAARDVAAADPRVGDRHVPGTGSVVSARVPRLPRGTRCAAERADRSRSGV